MRTEVTARTSRGALSILMLNWKDPYDDAAGGSETMVRRCAEMWAALDHRVTLFVPRPPGLAPEETINGVHYIRAGRLHSVFALARRYLRQHRRTFDVVIDSVSGRPFFAHQLVGDRATAVVHHVCEEQWQQEFRFPVSWLGRHVVEPWWLRRMRGSHLVAMSASTVRDLDRFGLSVAAVVQLGVDTPALIGPPRVAPRSAPQLLFLGRLIRAKRPHDAVAALQRIRAVYPDATLDVVGRGYLGAELQTLRAPGVRVHGFVSEVEKQRLLRSADLMLMPGTKEGWGIVTVEAAMQGVPVVGYDIAGVRDSVLNGRTGILTAPTPDALATATLDLLGDPARWRAYSSCATRRARAFTWDRTANQLLAAATAAHEVSDAARVGRIPGRAPAPTEVPLELAQS